MLGPSSGLRVWQGYLVVTRCPVFPLCCVQGWQAPPQYLLDQPRHRVGRRCTVPESPGVRVRDWGGRVEGGTGGRSRQLLSSRVAKCSEKQGWGIFLISVSSNQAHLQRCHSTLW